MTRKETTDALAQALGKLTIGQTTLQMAVNLTKELRSLGLECRPITVDSAARLAARADEHDQWATKYEADAREFEAQNNTVAAENRRQMARESRTRAAALRGHGVERP